MRRVLLAGLGLAVALAGCQGSGERDRFIYGLTRIPESLDPILVQDKEAELVTAQIFEGLVEFIPNDPNVKDCLAAQWEVSTDGRSYSFVLHENVLFQDGTPLNAEAVTYSLNRLLASYPPESSANAPTAAKFTDVIESVEPLNPVTIRIQLKEAYSPFLKDLARPCCGIVSPTAVQKWGDTFGNHPVGTGPFRFVNRESEQAIALEQWDGYWRTQPSVPQLAFVAAGEDSDRLTAVSEDQIHAAELYDPQTISIAESRGAVSIRKTMGVSVVGLAIECSKQPFASFPVRGAIAHSINKGGLVKRSLPRLAEVASSVLSPCMWGYREHPDPFPYNPEMARQLLTQAGYPNGFQTTLTVPSSPCALLPQPRVIAEALQADLEAVGIQTKLAFLSEDEMQRALREKQIDLSLQVLDSPNGDADSFLSVFASDSNAENPVPGPVVANLLDQVRGIINSDERRTRYAQLDDIILRNVPWVFLWHPYRVVAVGEDVDRFDPHPTGLHKFRDAALR